MAYADLWSVSTAAAVDVLHKESELSDEKVDELLVNRAGIFIAVLIHLAKAVALLLGFNQVEVGRSITSLP